MNLNVAVFPFFPKQSQTAINELKKVEGTRPFNHALYISTIYFAICAMTNVRQSCNRPALFSFLFFQPSRRRFSNQNRSSRLRSVEENLRPGQGLVAGVHAETVFLAHEEHAQREGDGVTL